MATILKYKLNGLEYTPPRDWGNLEVLATFQTENQDGSISESVQANITTSEFSFVNDAKNAIDTWFGNLPTEGMPLAITISNESGAYSAFKGYLDFRTIQYLSNAELKCSIKQDNGIATLDQRLRGISMELLQQKGFLTPSHFAHLPYIVENRKTVLERLYLLFQLYNLIKTSADEIFKFINISADITSGGIVQALINLATTIANLINLINQLVDLLSEIRDSFFPPIRYHKGISLKTAITQMLAYCGFTLETGAFDSVFSKVFLCPSKDDEIGYTTTTSPLSGILKPKDFGYVGSELFQLCNQLFFTKVAINGTVVQLRPFNDPFWIQGASYTMPNVKIEQAFINNGTRTINYNELMSSRILQYSTDDSDLWTLTNVNEQISVTTVSPIIVNNQNKVLLTGSEQITIPYSLCVRKDTLDELLDLFFGVSAEFDQIKVYIENQFNEVAGILGQSFPALATLTNLIPQRTGCMKVENHFFSSPKIVFLDTDNRIPSNYIDFIGARALQEDYHSYKSFVQGVRNPLNPLDTNAKDVYNDVTIPMGIDQFLALINNSYFNFGGGNIGKFTSIKWIPNKDQALVSFYVQSNWAKNLEENTI